MSIRNFFTFTLQPFINRFILIITIEMFKVIVIGNSNVGKTSIVNRFVGDRFDPNYKATISADFQTKILTIRGNEIRL